MKNSTSLKLHSKVFKLQFILHISPRMMKGLVNFHPIDCENSINYLITNSRTARVEGETKARRPRNDANQILRLGGC